MEWSSLFQGNSSSAPSSSMAPSFGGNPNASQALLTAASALANSNLNLSNAATAASLLQHLQGDHFLPSPNLPGQHDELPMHSKQTLSLHPEPSTQFFLQSSTQGSSGHSNSQGSFYGKSHPRTPDGLAASSMVSSWKSPNGTFPSQRLASAPQALRQMDTAELLLQAMQDKVQNPRSNTNPRQDDFEARFDPSNSDILEALLIKRGSTPELPASATSALLSKWLKDVEGQGGGSKGAGLMSTHADARSHGNCTQLSAQLLSQMLPGAGEYGEGALGAGGVTSSGLHTSLTQDDVIRMALAQLSQSPDKVVDLQGGRGAVGRNSQSRHGAGVGDALPAGMGFLHEPMALSSQQHHKEASEVKSVTPGMSLSMSLEGSGRSEVKTEEEKRKRKLALNREAARRMRQRQAMRLEQLEKTVLELQAANSATRGRLAEAEKRVSELESRNGGLEDRVVDVVQEIFLHSQPSDALKEKLAGLAQFLSKKALEKVPECAERLHGGEVVQERGGEGSCKEEQVGEKRKHSLCHSPEEKKLLDFPHFGVGGVNVDLDYAKEAKRSCSGSSYEEESE